jgi:hypothetical protein
MRVTRRYSNPGVLSKKKQLKLIKLVPYKTENIVSVSQYAFSHMCCIIGIYFALRGSE